MNPVEIIKQEIEKKRKQRLRDLETIYYMYYPY